MKRTISLLLIITLVILFTAACGREAESETFRLEIPTPPTAEDLGLFVVGASVEDKQNFDHNDKKVREALDAYQAVFEGQSDLFWEASEYETVKNPSQLVDFMVPRRTGRLTIIDLDDDTLPEVILSFLTRDETATSYDEDTFLFLNIIKNAFMPILTP